MPTNEENLPLAALVPSLACHTATGCFPMREFVTLALGYAACESEVRSARHACPSPRWLVAAALSNCHCLPRF